MEMESNLKNAYLTAYKMACSDFILGNFEEISQATNTFFDKISNIITVKYLNRQYFVHCDSGDICSEISDEEVTTTVKVLILHYLLYSKVKPLSGRNISFREVPGGGAIYYETFQKRAIFPLVKTFSNNIEGLYKAGEILGGNRESYGHASISLKVFPLVPITYIIWQGDDEVRPSGTILFDDSITSYLPGEDIVLAASFGVYEMMKVVSK